MKNQLFLLLLTAVSLFASAQKIDLEQLKTKAKNGDKQAQYNMGVYYSQSGDYKQAVKWYKKSAEQNYAFAQHNLGYCYEHGEGVPQDYEKAAEWYKKATAKGDPNAQNNLGVLYEEGLGVKKNLKKAVELYTLSAKQGHAEAQYNLGYCYYLGKGVPQSTETALEWFKAAAEQGLERAQELVTNIQENPKTLYLYK